MPLTLATQSPGEPEIFASIQGEGPSAGMPVAFLRLSRCNLACVWCDTAYTWRFEGDNRPHRSGETFERKANQVTLDEKDVAERIAALGQDRLVITGGEPLLQASRLAEMLQHLDTLEISREDGSLSADATGPRLRGDSMRVEVETNGTVDPPGSFDILVDQYNVSPKLSHSGNPADLALPEKMLDRWATDERAFFKFVIAEPEDVEEVLAIQRKHAIPSRRIFLMPEGTDSETISARERMLISLCMEHGFRLSDRLHIHLFGDTRGT